MFGANQPDIGFVTDQMMYGDSSPLSLGQTELIQPRAEGEIAFLLGSDLGRKTVTRDEVMEATAAVVPCFEIVDSRIRGWKTKFRTRSRTTPRAGCWCSATRESNRTPATLPRCGW